MTVDLTIGFKTENISAVTKAITRATGFKPELHDSLYVGEYDLFRMPEDLRVRYNFVDGTGDWGVEGFKEFPVLMTVDETERPEYFEALARDTGLATVVISRIEVPPDELIPGVSGVEDA